MNLNLTYFRKVSLAFAITCTVAANMGTVKAGFFDWFSKTEKTEGTAERQTIKKNVHGELGFTEEKEKEVIPTEDTSERFGKIGHPTEEQTRKTAERVVSSKETRVSAGRERMAGRERVIDSETELTLEDRRKERLARIEAAKKRGEAASLERRSEIESAKAKKEMREGAADVKSGLAEIGRGVKDAAHGVAEAGKAKSKELAANLTETKEKVLAAGETIKVKTGIQKVQDTITGGIATIVALPVLALTKTKDIIFHNAVSEWLGCPYKDKRLAAWFAIGGVVGALTYKYVSSKIDRQLLKNISSEDSANAIVQGLIVDRSKQHANHDALVAKIQARGFATPEEEIMLKNLEKDIAAIEACLASVLRSQKTFIEKVKLALTLDIQI